ncbi:MAG TPA: phosphate signaling complex protein PhoU [Microthrixaceae bacterium]|nr:phosphate signaling complex protein PhoU [Microthrixaceae bacterium]
MADVEHRHEFHDALSALRSEIVRLGAMTAETVSRGTAALLGKDLRAAQDLIDQDDIIDELTVNIEEQIFRLLALQNPMASDLRMLVCSLRFTSELERSADLMVNACKATRRLYDVDFDPRLRGLIAAMADEAKMLTQKAIDAYVDEDEALASALDDMDSRLDDLHRDFVEAIFTSHQTANLTLRQAVQLALIGRYYERIGDHAVNMGERVTFMITGWLPEYTGAARVDMRRRRSEPDAPS